MSQPLAHNMTYLTGDTAEHVITASPARLISLVVNKLTTGTITVRDANAIGGTNVVSLIATGAAIGGIEYAAPVGVKFLNGITVQLSAGTDVVDVIWDTVS